MINEIDTIPEFLDVVCFIVISRNYLKTGSCYHRFRILQMAQRQRKTLWCLEETLYITCPNWYMICFLNFTQRSLKSTLCILLIKQRWILRGGSYQQSQWQILAVDFLKFLILIFIIREKLLVAVKNLLVSLGKHEGNWNWKFLEIIESYHHYANIWISNENFAKVLINLPLASPSGRILDILIKSSNRVSSLLIGG